MFSRFRTPLLALVLAAPASLAAQSAQEFQLPPNPTPTASPNAQGPVDVEGSNVPAAPRVIATPTPTPTPTAQPSVQPLPTSSPTSVPGPTVAAPSPQPRVAPRRQPSPLPTAEPRLPLETGEIAPIVPSPAPTEQPTSLPAPTSSVAAQDDATGTDEGIDWLWPAIGGGLLALLGLGYLLSQRRRNMPPPEIERPVVSGGPTAIAPGALKIQAEAIKLTRSLMNATLHYRVSLMNRSNPAISDIAVGADIVSAHGGVSVDQQVASATQPLERRHSFARIAPGQSVRYDGQLSIPLSQVHAIRQGSAALFVPLLRLRVDGASLEPLVKTFVVGLGSQPGGRVTPFRLDEGPRSYEPIAARALD